MGIADEKYAVVVTYTKDGRPKPTAIWPVDAGDGKVGFVTGDQSWKVKRLRNDDRVQLQPSDARGNVKDGTSAVDGTGVVVYGAEFDAVQAAVKAKYGWQMAAIQFVDKIRGLFPKKTDTGAECAVVITLD